MFRCGTDLPRLELVQVSNVHGIAFQWGVSSYTGWGVYGLNLLLNWSKRDDLVVACSRLIKSDALDIDPLERAVLQPALLRSQNLCNELSGHADKVLRVPFAVLHALSSDFATLPAAHGVALDGSPSIGIVFTERAVVAPESRERAKRYPLIVVGSRWNLQVLTSAGIDRAALVVQGVDPAYFHPAPRAGLLAGRFTVFSGGKLEKRKGQDFVVRAFRIFAERHPDALLMTSWGSPWPKIALGLNDQPDLSPIQLTSDGEIDTLAWTTANGIAPHQVLHFGPLPNSRMARILREADAALFTSRAEGGTNLTAMEAMACGVPTILSANTGHLDLIEGRSCYPLRRQTAMSGPGCEGWGESDTEEIVETLEWIYRDRAEAEARGRRAAEDMAQLTWSRQLDLLAQTVRPFL
jgi:glycosyltransferase involved in cell wall biosynthesis